MIGVRQTSHLMIFRLCFAFKKTTGSMTKPFLAGITQLWTHSCSLGCAATFWCHFHVICTSPGNLSLNRGISLCRCLAKMPHARDDRRQRFKLRGFGQETTRRCPQGVLTKQKSAIAYSCYHSGALHVGPLKMHFCTFCTNLAFD